MRISVFDIGGTWIKHAVFDGESLSETDQIPTEAHLGTEQMLNKITSILKAELSCGPLDAVGISTRGQVNPSDGSILFDPPDVFPDYTGICLPRRIHELLGNHDLIIAVENDANCAALAESVFGASRRFDDSLLLTFGTCIGGGIVLNRQIHHGDRFSAGEFGMMYLPDENGLPKHWEQLASNQLLEENPDLWIRRVSMGIASLIHVFNPPCVVLGGGLMEDNERAFQVCQNVYPLLAPGFDHLTIAKAELGNRAGMLGAGYLALKFLSEKGCGHL